MSREFFEVLAWLVPILGLLVLVIFLKHVAKPRPPDDPSSKWIHITRGKRPDKNP